ncbi:MAG: hypothetical protein K6C08_12705 [Oscillospiraceae bacterium]|nr:hypothetical protein [Oscillospiraceae bacterium]
MNYDDIINLPHPVSKKYPQLSMAQRAAQFNPFAALTGYDVAVEESARLTDDERYLDEESISSINAELMELKSRLKEKPSATVCYFESDDRKSGGTCRTVTGIVEKIDEYQNILQIGGTVIDMSRIMSLEAAD